MEEEFDYRSEKNEDKLPSPVRLVSIENIQEQRINTNQKGFDHVLDGGLVPGSVVLLGGEPGIGKSTLLLQVADSIKEPVLYVNGEESVKQTSMRANRLSIDTESSEILLLPETNVERLIEVVENNVPELLVVDSIQSLYSDEYDSTPGSITQVKECTNQLVRFAKQSDIPIVLISHINKSGNIAGPKAIEHFADVVMSFTKIDDVLRELKASKNRFGSIVHSACYKMKAEGLVSV